MKIQKDKKMKENELNSEDIQTISNELLRLKKGQERAMTSRHFDILNSTSH